LGLQPPGEKPRLREKEGSKAREKNPQRGRNISGRGTRKDRKKETPVKEKVNNPPVYNEGKAELDGDYQKKNQ